MKNYYFLSGLPRAGNTLFGYLLNKNKDITLTSNSILPDVLLSLFKIKHEDVYINFPDEKSFNDIYNNVFNHYFKNWKANTIICRGPWGTKGNLILLKPIIEKPKFIVLYRPVEECLNSFIDLYKVKNIKSYAKKMLSLDGILGRALMSTENIMKTKQDHIVIYYKDLIKNPEREIKRAYKYLNIKYTKISFNVDEQFQSNGIEYDDKIFKQPLHKLTLGKIRKLKSPNRLSKELIKKCRSLDLF
jgi:hypothetical protein|tara:strand:- start:77 stop:811 length:735 start_codon:yes stop_codon:yes gene_type:complete